MTEPRSPDHAVDLPGLPTAAIREWLADQLSGSGTLDPWHAEVISGGLSNITYRLRLPDRTLILRRPPLGPLLPRAHDVAREHRVLSALAHTSVPVPEPLGLCTDPAVIGAPFYVMPEITGEVLRTAEDTATLSPAERSAIGSELATTLAALHSVDPESVGLGDYGRPSGYCARQVRTWGKQWDASRTRDLPEMTSLLTALQEHTPADSGLAIVHGDYRLDNTIVDRTGTPRIAAVLDWELSTLGDPLADLATAITYWHDLGDDERAQLPVAAGVTAWPGFPTSREFADLYASARGIELPDLSFHLALGAMKLAVILEGVHARYLAGKTVGDGYDTAGAAVPMLVRRARRHLGT